METQNAAAILTMDPGSARVKAVRAAEAAKKASAADAEITAEEQLGGELRALRDAAAQALKRYANAEKRRAEFASDALTPAHERYMAATTEHASLQAAAEDARRERDRLAGELHALESSAKSPYRFTGPNKTLDDASIEYALSRITRDEASNSFYTFADHGRVPVGGDGLAWQSLQIHEMHLPGAELRAYHARLAAALGL